MKIDKEKIGKIMKNKKAMKTIMMGCVLLAVAFYGIAIVMGNFGITLGHDIMLQWGNIFVVIVVLFYAYKIFVFDTKEKVHKCPKCNAKEYEVWSKPFSWDKDPKEKRKCKKCGNIYEVPVVLEKKKEKENKGE